MHSRIRRLIAAVVGVLGVASGALAQAPQPAAPANPAKPAPAQPAVPPPIFVQAPPAQFVGDCTSAATPAPAAMSCKTGLGSGRIWNAIKIGEGCPNTVGCSNWAVERTFIFGSCNNFFNPGNKCGRGGCASSPLGTGGIGDHGICTYGSYLNR